MQTQGNIVAGGVEFPLMKMVVEFDSLATEDSGRTDDGNMHITWIKNKNRLRKVKCTLPPTPHAEIGAYLDAVLGRIYQLTYLDPIEGEKTIWAYTSAGSAELYNARLHGGLWYNISFNAIEYGDAPKEGEG